MDALRPSQTYVFGKAGQGLSFAFYLVGYPIFLWVCLPQVYKGFDHWYTYAAGILAFKFIFEGIFDILTSGLADIKRIFSRRQAFLFGMGGQGLAFIILFIVAGTKLSSTLAFSLLLLVELTRSMGNALQSGTFDGWAVSAEIDINPDFNKAKMFAAARIFDRLFMIVGTILTLVLIYLGKQSPDTWIKATFISVWGVATLFHWIIIFIIWQFSSKIAEPTITHKENEESHWAMLKKVFTKKSLPAIGLAVSFYSMAMLVTFTWPIILKEWSEKPTSYVIILAFLFSGMIGSMFASRKSKLIIEAVDRTKYAWRWGIAEAVVIFFIALGSVISTRNWWSPALYMVMGLLVISRFMDFMADPFVDSLIHENIEPGEQIRAYVVSWRSAVSNIIAGLFFLGVTSYISKTNSQEVIAIALLIMSFLVPVLMLLATHFSKQATKVKLL